MHLSLSSSYTNLFLKSNPASRVCVFIQICKVTTTIREIIRQYMTEKLLVSSSSSKQQHLKLLHIVSNVLAFIITHFPSLPLHVSCIRRLDLNLIKHLFDDEVDEECDSDDNNNNNNNNLSLSESRYCLLRAAWLVLLRMAPGGTDEKNVVKDCCFDEDDDDEIPLIAEDDEDDDDNDDNNDDHSELNVAGIFCKFVIKDKQQQNATRATNNTISSNDDTSSSSSSIISMQRQDVMSIISKDDLRSIFGKDDGDDDDDGHNSMMKSNSIVSSSRSHHQCSLLLSNLDQEKSNEDDQELFQINQLQGIWLISKHHQIHQKQEDEDEEDQSNKTFPNSSFLSSSTTFVSSLLSCAWRLDLDVMIREIFLSPAVAASTLMIMKSSCIIRQQNESDAHHHDRDESTRNNDEQQHQHHIIAKQKTLTLYREEFERFVSEDLGIEGLMMEASCREHTTKENQNKNERNNINSNSSKIGVMRPTTASVPPSKNPFLDFRQNNNNLNNNEDKKSQDSNTTSSDSSSNMFLREEDRRIAAAQFPPFSLSSRQLQLFKFLGPAGGDHHGSRCPSLRHHEYLPSFSSLLSFSSRQFNNEKNCDNHHIHRHQAGLKNNKDHEEVELSSVVFSSTTDDTTDYLPRRRCREERDKDENR